MAGPAGSADGGKGHGSRAGMRPRGRGRVRVERSRPSAASPEEGLARMTPSGHVALPHRIAHLTWALSQEVLCG
jgi:hypothetical protein